MDESPRRQAFEQYHQPGPQEIAFPRVPSLFGGAAYAVARATSFRAASPNISLDIPVISRFTPTIVPIAQIELDGQWNQMSPPSKSVMIPFSSNPEGP